MHAFRSTLVSFSLLCIPILTLSAAPASAKRIAFAAAGVDAHQVINQLAKTREGKRNEFVDVSDAYAALILPIVFNLESRKPNGWPTALNQTWDDGVNGCKARGENSRSSGVFLCGRQLSPALFQSYIDHLKVDEVVILTVHRNPKSLVAKAMRFAPGATSAKYGTSTGRDIVKGSVAAIQASSQLGAPSAKRQVYRNIPKSPSKVDPMLTSGKVNLEIPPVVYAKICDEAKVGVTISPATSPFSKTLTSLMKRSILGEEPARTSLQCELEAWENPTNAIFGKSIKSISTSLRCEGMAHVDVVVPGIRIDDIQKKMAQGIAKKFVDTRCGYVNKRGRRPRR